MPSKRDFLFSQAALEWDLLRLYKDLARVKGKRLSEKTDKVYLRGLLCGYSPAEIAKKLVRGEESVEVALSNGIYYYVKVLLNKPEDDKLNNWNEIRTWLEKAGYKINLTNQQQTFQPQASDSTMPIQIFSRIINRSLVSNGVMLVNIHTSLIFPISPDAEVGGGQNQGEKQENGGSEGGN